MRGLVVLVLSALAADAQLGGSRDAGGCFTSAGYSYCAVEDRCVRMWELGTAEARTPHLWKSEGRRGGQRGDPSGRVRDGNDMGSRPLPLPSSPSPPPDTMPPP